MAASEIPMPDPQRHAASAALSLVAAAVLFMVALLLVSNLLDSPFIESLRSRIDEQLVSRICELLLIASIGALPILQWPLFALWPRVVGFSVVLFGLAPAALVLADLVRPHRFGLSNHTLASLGSISTLAFFVAVPLLFILQARRHFLFLVSGLLWITLPVLGLLAPNPVDSWLQASVAIAALLFAASASCCAACGYWRLFNGMKSSAIGQQPSDFTNL